MDHKELLINLLIDTDLSHFTEDDGKLEYAIDYAKAEIAKRIRCTVAQIPAKYDYNIVNGALWYLARMGSEGESSHQEGTVSRSYEEVPEWLKSVIPSVGVVKLAGTR